MSTASEPVSWRTDGVPRSERFDEIYHCESGAAAQAGHVFLGGCGLPMAWAGQAQWSVLETGFGLGLNFLTCWQAWRADPMRPGFLHFVSVEAFPVGREDLLRAVGAYPELAPFTLELAAQWHGLLPGFHRLGFEGGHVLLTLCIGGVRPMLRTQRPFEANSIFLDGFSPDRNPDMWSGETLKRISRFARRGTRLATWSVARTLCDALAPLGFQVRKLPGLPPRRDCLGAMYDPAWQPRRPQPAPELVTQPGTCVVLGAGLAGAAVAASLARRGWQVSVLDGAAHPAAAASALPVGLMAPHVSPDDGLLSRLSRVGIRVTWLQLEQLLQEGHEWAPSGVLERREDARLPAEWSAEGPNESWHATPAHLQAAGLPEDTAALWHARAAWVRPRRLVKAWLGQPGIRLLSSRCVARIVSTEGAWQALDAQGSVLAKADRIVIAAGYDSHRFAPTLPLQPVRGQVIYGQRNSNLLPPCPINGDGHLITGVPQATGESLWLAGSTYERGSRSIELNEAGTQTNLERMARLHPGSAVLLAADAQRGQIQAWAGVRCASNDRRPLVGPADPRQPMGPWVCTALGSRGLTFAALCAELLAARWHGEPLPLPASMADALDTRRLPALC